MCLLLVTVLTTACGRGDPAYARVPELERTAALVADGDTLRPIRLRIHRDTLWVSYRDLPRIDGYDLSLRRVARVPLIDPGPVRPTDFAVTDSAFYVCDHASRAIVIYGRDGAYRESFDTLPDGETRLSPLAITHFGGVLYSADIKSRRVLAISVADAAGITETGELILTIPGPDERQIGFPSAVHVTDDGRLLVGDAESGAIRVFTCDGRPIYRFEPVPGQDAFSPQGFDVDRVRDPGLRDESTFDPSGLAGQGRYHVLDSHSGRVHLFNPLGKYVASYPERGVLEAPAGIAVDRAGGRVFVADPPARRIAVFRLPGA